MSIWVKKGHYEHYRFEGALRERVWCVVHCCRNVSKRDAGNAIIDT